MSDPFLRAHKLSPRLYSLEGRTPLSIRDQLVRAQTLIERLLLTQVLVPGSKLAVVGAGAAGATVAVIAARRGIMVNLIDSSPSTFSLQRICRSRWIDPVQYDWPLSSSNRREWPSPRLKGKAPFGFTAGFASDIASGWAKTLSSARKGGGISLECNTKLMALPKRSASFPNKIDVVTEQSKRTLTTRQFDLVILATGMGSERTEVSQNYLKPKLDKRDPRFSGLQFWQSDSFQSPNLGLHWNISKLVLVSGGGDGGLQDYIRLMTGCKSVLEFIDDVFATIGWDAQEQRRFMLPLQEMEHESERACQWNEKAIQDHEYLEALHRGYRDAVNTLRSGPQWNKVLQFLQSRMKGRPTPNIRLIHSCNHFGACYPLNHFAALLVDAAATQLTGESSIRSNERLVAARPTNGGSTHTCSPGCWGPEHEVWLARSTCHQSMNGGDTPQVVSGLIVRHGIRKARSAGWIRHILPRELM